MSRISEKAGRAALVTMITLGAGTAAEGGVRMYIDSSKRTPLVKIVDGLGDASRDLAPNQLKKLSAGSSYGTFILPTEPDYASADERLLKVAGSMRKHGIDTTFIDGESGVLSDIRHPNRNANIATQAQQTIFEAAHPVAQRAQELDSSALWGMGRAFGAAALGAVSAFVRAGIESAKLKRRAKAYATRQLI